MDKSNKERRALEKIPIGTIFGKLTVQSYAAQVPGRTSYNCVCECEEELVVTGTNLRLGRTKSCLSCVYIKNVVKIKPGDVFGNLTVVRHVGTNSNRHSVWECICGCGGIDTYVGSALKIGSVTTCKKCSVRRTKDKEFFSNKVVKRKKGPGYLYCFESIGPSGPIIKIGRSTNPKHRFQHLKSGNPFLKVVWLKEGYAELEKSFHKKLTELGLHIGGEWFKKPEDMSILEYL